MSESQRKLAVPKAALPEPRGWTCEEVAKYITYQLSELSTTNGHHEFEQLCFQLARKRIYPNIIPSTGPVSAGGDQGSDFETFETGLGGTSPFFATASDEEVVFACSLEKNYKSKIKADLSSIAAARPSAAKIVFFSNGSIPIGVRHKLEAYAKGRHRIDLAIFDSLAISHMLADAEVFWIATRFLSIPSEVFLADVGTQNHDWYETAKKLNIDPQRPRAADFYVVKRAVRYATVTHSCHSDIPSLIKKLRLFQTDHVLGIARRAFYEEFVASLRGLEFVKDCASGLQQYFDAVPTLTDGAGLEDAAVLLHYAVGARMRRLLDIPLDQVLEWRRSLAAQILALLREDISPGRRSSLLDVKAFLTLLDWIEDVAKDENADVVALGSKCAEAAFALWLKMLKYVRQSPMFPLERFARRLPHFEALYGEAGNYEKLLQETDKLVASRAGRQKVGEHAYERATAYCEAGRTLDAIDQLHVAHISSFTRETALETVYIPLFLAKLYSQANLFAAAKYYSLASSYAALKVGEDKLLPHIYRGLAEAAASDHANGATLGFFLTLKATVFIASQFSASGSDEIQNFEWGRLHFYAFILTYGASLVSKELAENLVNDLLPSVGLGTDYADALPETARFFQSYTNYSALASEAINEGVAPPFADTLARRRLSWRQLGIKWTVEWENNYRTTVEAEGFIALLQILLTDLRKTEMSLFPADVELSLKLHPGELHIASAPSNERVIREISLPEQGAKPELVFGVAATILKDVSAYPQERFLSIIKHRVELGLPNKTNPHAPYNTLFHEFYLEEDFQKLHGFTAEHGIEIPAFAIETDDGLSGSSGIHKDYDSKQSHQAIENRYTNSQGILKHTLVRLNKDPNFSATVEALRKEGWKDWHILLAAGGVRLNFVVDEILPKSASESEHKRVFHEFLKRDELETDSAPPTEIFTVDKL